MAEILTTVEFPVLTENFVNSTLVASNHEIFANGLSANNKILGSYDEINNIELRDRVTQRAAELIVASGCEFDFIAPVPTGAVGWAYSIIRSLKITNVPVLLFEKEKGEKRKFQTTSFSDLQIEWLKERYEKPRGIVIDDVTSDGGTNEAMADFLTDKGLGISLVFSLLYRGELSRLLESDRKYKRAYLMAKHIPYSIDWKERKDSGLIVPLRTKVTAA